MANLPHSFIHSISDNFNPDVEFKDYPHWEEYDPNKEYTNNIFKHDFGKYGEKKYVYWLETFGHGQNVKEFIVAKEILSKEDEKELGKYCQCKYCKGNKWTRLFTCPCCVGCINSSFPQQYYINKAREIKEQDVKNPTSCIIC